MGARRSIISVGPADRSFPPRTKKPRSWVRSGVGGFGQLSAGLGPLAANVGEAGGGCEGGQGQGARLGDAGNQGDGIDFPVGDGALGEFVPGAEELHGDRVGAGCGG